MIFCYCCLYIAVLLYVTYFVSSSLTVFSQLFSETPKKTRPKSLAISTPTKLLSLEEARNRALTSNLPGEHQKFIDVGGGEENLPIKYHTVIDLPTRYTSVGWRASTCSKSVYNLNYFTIASLTGASAERNLGKARFWNWCAYSPDSKAEFLKMENIIIK